MRLIQCLPPLPPQPPYTPPPPPYTQADIDALLAQLNPTQQPTYPAPTGPQQYQPGELIRRFMSGLDPRTYYRKLLPSQIDFLGSIVSGLGVDPRDFFTSVERQFPTGVDPSQIYFGTNI